MSLNLVIKDSKSLDNTEIYLSPAEDGVDVMIDDIDGETWYLFKIKNDGTFYRYEEANGKNVKVDVNGRIKESQTEESN